MQYIATHLNFIQETGVGGEMGSGRQDAGIGGSGRPHPRVRHRHEAGVHQDKRARRSHIHAVLQQGRRVHRFRCRLFLFVKKLICTCAF